MVRSIARACGLLGVVLVAGCAGQAGSSPVPVNGTVTVGGKPVVGAMVEFQPESPGGKPAFGTVEADGTFRLTTNTAGDGAMPGKYKVTIQPPAQGGGSPYDDPAKASAPIKTPTGPKVPAKYTRVDQTPLTQTVPASGPVAIELQGP
jgi:hypothetical protein